MALFVFLALFLFCLSRGCICTIGFCTVFLALFICRSSLCSWYVVWLAVGAAPGQHSARRNGVGVGVAVEVACVAGIFKKTTVPNGCCGWLVGWMDGWAEWMCGVSPFLWNTIDIWICNSCERLGDVSDCAPPWCVGACSSARIFMQRKANNGPPPPPHSAHTQTTAKRSPTDGRTDGRQERLSSVGFCTS